MWMDKLERKIGRFAIPHLMRYIVFGNVAVLLISMFQPSFVNTLVLAPELVLNGQIWRLISFIFIPPSGYNIFFVLISLYCYYWIGDTLEKMCGAFRFNVYYLEACYSLLLPRLLPMVLVFLRISISFYLLR